MNYAEFYQKNAGKQVRVEMTDGEIFVGELFAYISAADNDPDPRCILGKDWDLIKLDIIDWTKELL